MNLLRIAAFLFLARREMMILSLMVLAIFGAILWRGYKSRQDLQSKNHQIKAGQMLQSGPDLVLLQVDPIAASAYEDQLSNAKQVAKFNNFIVVYGRPSSNGDFSEIFDADLRGRGSLPPPNLVLKSSVVQANEIILRFYYAFQGPDALQQANQFLAVYAEEIIPKPYLEYSQPDIDNGVLDFGWQTKLVDGSPISAKMWWGDQQFMGTHEDVNGEFRYIMLPITHRSFQQRLIPLNVSIKKVQ